MSSATKGSYLEFMTWPEAEEAFREFNLVILPLGARCKEHGHHLPLNNDWNIAEYYTKRVLKEVRALALPTMQYGYYPAFTEYPGSTHVREGAFRDTVIDICSSLHAQGKVLDRNLKFYVINTGISTIAPLHTARELLKKAGITMDFLDVREVNKELIEEISEQSAGTHADEIETSMMLYMTPETVRMNLAKKDIHGGPETRGPLTRKENPEKGLYSPSGVWGDATLATREKGKVIVEGLIHYLVNKLQKVAEGGESFDAD